jgi:DNA-binding Lrp family transcriptional regulator
LRRLKRRLDAVDLEILRILVRDCNIEVTRLAKMIGLSVPSTRRRIRYLLSSGILRGCSATIDSEALGVYTVVIRFRGEGLEEILKGLDGNRSVERVYYSSSRGEGFVIAKIPSLLDIEIIAEDMRKRGQHR